MLPGFLLMFALSWLYFQIDIAGTALGAAFLGMQAAVIALIVRAVHRIGEHILLDRWLWPLPSLARWQPWGVDFWITLPGVACVRPARAQASGLSTARDAGSGGAGHGHGIWAEPTAKLVETVVRGQTSVLLIFAAGLKAACSPSAAPTQRFPSFATTPSGAGG